MRLLILVQVLVSVTSHASAASGAAWYTVGDARISMGTRLHSLDTLDSSDFSAIVAYGWTAGSYHGVDEWGDAAGFYRYDLRAPLESGQTKTWMLYIWGVSGVATDDFGVSWSGSSDPLVQAKLEYVQRPTGITGGPALGTVWTTPPASFTLPLYTATNGLTGYGFKFTLTAVPEPSSILALAGGIAGLGGLALRRKRV